MRDTCCWVIRSHSGRWRTGSTSSRTREHFATARCPRTAKRMPGRIRRSGRAPRADRRVLYLDDSLALAHFWLGNLYRDRGDIARACHEYENVVRDWERHTLALTEEFATDLSAQQLVDFCRSSLQRLRPCGT